MNELPDDGATLFVGIPGCGKTYRAMAIHDSIYEYSVFFNTMRKDYSRSPRVRRLDDEAIKKLNQPPYKLTVDEDDPEAVAKWIEFFERVWDRSRMGILRLWFDETDEFARCYSHDSPVERVFTKDRNRGILGVAICQSHSGQISAIIKKNAHAYYIWRLHPGEFAEYGQRFYGLPENPPVNPGSFSPYYRYTLGHLYYAPREGVEVPVGTEGEELIEPEAEEVGEPEAENDTEPDDENAGEGPPEAPEPSGVKPDGKE
ncbi:MAG: hypothetical protein ACUVV3_10300 [Dehalococcoidia bacterium]